MSFVRVLIVDDFEPWVRLVQFCISQQPNMQVIGVARDGREALRKAEQFQPDLILLDVSLPELDGIQAAMQIRRLAPGTAMLLLSEGADPEIVEAALNAGGHGYVLKSQATRDLVAGIEAVLRGERFVSDGLMGYEDLT